MYFEGVDQCDSSSPTLNYQLLKGLKSLTVKKNEILKN